MNGKDLTSFLGNNGFYQNDTFFNRQDGDTTARVTVLAQDRAEFMVIAKGVLVHNEVADLDRVAECIELYV